MSRKNGKSEYIDNLMIVFVRLYYIVLQMSYSLKIGSGNILSGVVIGSGNVMKSNPNTNNKRGPVVIGNNNVVNGDRATSDIPDIIIGDAQNVDVVIGDNTRLSDVIIGNNNRVNS